MISFWDSESSNMHRSGLLGWSVVVIIILFVIGVVLTNFYDELLIFYLDQLYESQIAMDISYLKSCMKMWF